MKRAPFLRLTLAATVALLPTAPAFAQATPPDVTFELRPHCVDPDATEAENQFGGDVPQLEGVTTPTEDSALPCPSYPVKDPFTRQTNELSVGDVLDMDLVLHNPSGRDLTRFRAWIAYDSNILQGASIDIADAFPVSTPGEADFSVADNYVKLSGSSEQARSQTKIVLARITMSVKVAAAMGTVLSFHEANGKPDAHTGAFEGEENVAAVSQGSLAVRIRGAASASSISSVAAGTGASSIAASSAPASSAPAVSSVPASSAAPAPTLFAKLQVQALRVTTEGSSAFLAWNPLPSAELAGYNLYYGSISGRYLQRRSVEKESQTLTIRALPVGQTYFFAVRAVNAQGQESDFSREVAVTIGNPATSTSPLSGALIEGGPRGNAPSTNGSVAGDSGPGSWFALFAVVSAVMGTAFAFRRQWTATVSRP